MKKENSFFLISLGIFILSVLILIFILFANSSILLKKTSLPIKAEIGNKTGFNLENSSINFGIILPDSGAKRKIEISNNYSSKIFVKIYSKGNISDALYFPEKTFINKNSIKKIPIIFSSKNMKKGKYFGNLIIEYRKKRIFN